MLHTRVRDGASKGKPESRQWLDDCFYNRITRKVRKDSTVTIDGVCYDVPMQFISAKVDIRLFCLMIRSARFARPIATKIIPAQKNKISASQINLFSMRWLLIDIHLMFSDTPCAVIKNVKTLKLL